MINLYSAGVAMGFCVYRMRRLCREVAYTAHHGVKCAVNVFIALSLTTRLPVRACPLWARHSIRHKTSGPHDFPWEGGGNTRGTRKGWSHLPIATQHTRV